MRVMQAVLVGMLVLMAACSPAPTEVPAAVPTAVRATQAPATQAPAAPVPAVVVSHQDAGQGIVVIDEISAAEPGWIVIHLNVDGAPGPVIGHAAVQPGLNEAVPVEIDLSRATPELFAMLHVDRGVLGEYEFPGEDVPAMAADVMVNEPFTVMLPTPAASVTASDQSAVNGTVVVDQVVAAQAGWIVIHIDANGAPGPVIGFAPVVAGANPDVAVAIDLAQATPTLHAMLHVDAGTLGKYEFPGEDGPVLAGDAVVMVPFRLLAPEAGGSEVAVTIVDGAFRDKEISVPVGTTVVWTSSASASHTVTADDGSFSSGTLRPGESFRFTFTSPGSFPYYCGFHGGQNGAGMSGVVTVTP
jgi:plastocyanin